MKFKNIKEAFLCFDIAVAFTFKKNLLLSFVLVRHYILQFSDSGMLVNLLWNIFVL